MEEKVFNEGNGRRPDPMEGFEWNWSRSARMSNNKGYAVLCSLA